MERAITAEAESAEFRNLQNKRRELERKASDARTSSYAAEKEVEFIEEGLKTRSVGQIRRDRRKNGLNQNGSGRGPICTDSV